MGALVGIAREESSGFEDSAGLLVVFTVGPVEALPGAWTGWHGAPPS